MQRDRAREKGSTVQASSAAGAMSAAAVGAGAGTATAIAAGTALTGAARPTAVRGAAAGIVIAAIFEVERRGTEIYVACMRERGYASANDTIERKERRDERSIR